VTMRMAQFQIDQRCPEGVPRGPEVWPPFPICVWVYLEPPPPQLPCGKALFRIDASRDVISSDGNTYKLSPPLGYTPVVCEHMGHLIE
jgi:hypothetical protein